jgi:2'-phosphotransferase
MIVRSSYLATQGLSKMKRNHIHLAQGIAGQTGQNVISGKQVHSPHKYMLT